jgi:hypothetical protein
MQSQTALTIQPLEVWLPQRIETDWVTGPGLAAYAARLPAGTPTVDGTFWYPEAASVLRVGWDRFVQGERDDFRMLEPLYLRPSAAEEKWDKRKL